jgi:glycosyltransferase involved in cell wall biosynthesis
MKKIILSAFACQPGKGSEEGGGWNWSNGLAKQGYEVHCLTWDLNKEFIENQPPQVGLHFHYVTMPKITRKIFFAPGPAIYGIYLLWQLLAYRKAKRLHKKLQFDIAHHVSWGNIQMGSFLYKLNIPFIFGPAGGGQKAPEAFKAYFKENWSVEIKREKTSNLLLKYNPACKNMLKSAHAVLVPNQDTLILAKNAGAQNCYFSFDAALPESYFPEELKIKEPKSGSLNLLWVGRFESRKGLLLTLEVMRSLKSYPGIKLTVVGYGEREQETRDYIKDNDLAGTVTLTGKVPFETVRDYYAENDVFFFTSLRDSGPAQLIEAMAFGMPVVTINLHGQAILVNDETGIRCSIESPEKTITELKAALIGLLENPKKVTEMSIAAAKFARQQTWSEKIAIITSTYYPE